jgi:hypothetical protein
VSPGVFHHFVQRGSACLRSAYSVICINFDDLEPSPGSKLPEIKQLRLGMLIDS